MSPIGPSRHSAGLQGSCGRRSSVWFAEQNYYAVARSNPWRIGSLLGKVLPTTLAASESDGGLATKLTFERVIVWPSGHREIEGVTPKSLPAPSHALPNSGESNTDPSDINKLED
jgi:hypothetical protein